MWDGERLIFCPWHIIIFNLRYRFFKVCINITCSLIDMALTTLGSKVRIVTNMNILLVCPPQHISGVYSSNFVSERKFASWVLTKQSKLFHPYRCFLANVGQYKPSDESDKLQCKISHLGIDMCHFASQRCILYDVCKHHPLNYLYTLWVSFAFSESILITLQLFHVMLV